MNAIELRYITEGITGEEAAGIIHGNDEKLLDGLGKLDREKLDAEKYTAKDVLDKLKTVDGPGSGLSADDVDGLHVWSGTKKEYEDLPEKNENTVYVIRGEATYFEILTEAKSYTDERETLIRRDFAAADNGLREAIDAETERAKTEEAAIRGGADEEYNTLRKLQTYIEAINRAISGTDTPDVIDTLNEALAFIREHQSEIESLVGTYIKKTAIADNLTTEDANRVLSARQGVVLDRQNKELSGEVSRKLDSTAYTASDVLSKLLTVDGRGSGLSADTVAEQRTGAAFKIWYGTKAEYEAVASKDSNTVYLVRND